MTQVNQVDIGKITELQDTCRAGIECMLGDAVATALVVLVTGVVSVILLLALVHGRDAMETIAEERARTVAERDGFAAFARRIASMDADDTGTGTGPVARRDGGPPRDRNLPIARGRATVGPGSAPGSAPGLGGAGIATVETAYRATVMDVPHYEEEYDEPFETHLGAEFGGDVARAIRHEDALTPQLQTVLVTKAHEARDVRDDLVASIDEEERSIRSAQQTLGDVEDSLVSMAARPITDRSYDELLATYDRLDGLETRCQDYLTERQHQIHDQPFNRGGVQENAPDSLQEYLYGPLSVSYPVLADGANLIDQIRTARRRVASAIATGPGATAGRS